MTAHIDLTSTLTHNASVFRGVTAGLRVPTRAHHRHVIRPIRRHVVASLLAATIVATALLPPMHIHLLADHDHDHGGVIEHAHWTAHHQPGAEVRDDDGRVLFVDRPAVPSAANQSVDRPATAVIAVLIPQGSLTFTIGAQRASGNAPRDGPSRASSLLRAPPVFPAFS